MTEVERDTGFDAVAEAIAAAWTDADHVLPEPPALSLSDGYRTQAAVVSALSSPVVGYRIVASSTAARERLSTDGPLVGVVTERNVSPVDATAPVRPGVVEAEFAVVVDLTLDEPADPVRILSWHLSLDLPRSRFAGEWSTLTAGQIVADTALLGDVVIGPGTGAANTSTVCKPGELTMGSDDAERHPLPAPDPDRTSDHLRLVKEAVVSGLVPAPAVDAPFVQLGTEKPLRLGDAVTAITLTHPDLGRIDLGLPTNSHLTGDNT